MGGSGPSLINLGGGAGATGNGTLVNLNLASGTQLPAVGGLLGGANAGGVVSGLTSLPGLSTVQSVVTAVLPVVTTSALGALPPAASGGLASGLPVVGSVLGGLGATSGAGSATGALTSLPVVGTVVGAATGGGAAGLLSPVTGLLVGLKH